MTRKNAILVLALYLFAAAAGVEAQERIIAVMPFSTRNTAVKTENADYYLDRLEEAILDTIDAQLVARGDLKDILSEYDATKGISAGDMEKLGSDLRAKKAGYVALPQFGTIGSKTYIHIAIYDVIRFQEVAGAYLEYSNESAIASFIDKIAKDIGVKFNTYQDLKNTENKLSIVPFRKKSEYPGIDTDFLMDMIATDLVNTGLYAVYPRLPGAARVIVEADYRGAGIIEEEDEEKYEIELVKKIGGEFEKENSGEADEVGDVRLGDYVMTGSIGELVTGSKTKQVITAKIWKIPGALRLRTDAKIEKMITKFEDILESVIKKRSRDQKTNAFFHDDNRFWSIGVSAGTSFTAPWLIATVNLTASFFPYTILELGCDAGFIHGYSGEEADKIFYYSLYPFGHFGFFAPLGGVRWYAAAGGGYMMAHYGETLLNTYALDAAMGLFLGRGHHYLNVSYTIRTPVKAPLFEVFNHKISAGYTYRF